jgi:hypothetical protein
MRRVKQVLGALALLAASRGEDWPVWGGKNRDFIVSTSGLADSWPASGPKKLWSRPIGDGYSAIAEEGGVLYTAFRRGMNDVVTALDAATGQTLWEHVYPNPFTNDFSEKVGPGPYAMPQVIGRSHRISPKRRRGGVEGAPVHQLLFFAPAHQC